MHRAAQLYTGFTRADNPCCFTWCKLVRDCRATSISIDCVIGLKYTIAKRVGQKIVTELMTVAIAQNLWYGFLKYLTQLLRPQLNLRMTRRIYYHQIGSHFPQFLPKRHCMQCNIEVFVNSIPLLYPAEEKIPLWRTQILALLICRFLFANH